MYKPSPSHQKFLNILTEKNRKNFAIGGGAFVGKDLGTREGFSKIYGPNIRKSTISDSFEVNINRGGKNFYKTFSYGDQNVRGPKPSYATKEEALKAANKFRDSVKNLPKATGKGAKGRPVGTKLETGPAAEIRRILNQFIAEGKTFFSNEDIRQLVNKDLFDTDRTLVTAIDRVKKEPEFKNLNFIVKQRDRLDFFTDPFIRKTIKENYKKLKQESLAKLVFPDEPLTTSKGRLGVILSDMADKGEIERLKPGEASEERLQDFDSSPEAEKKARIGRRRRKKIDILGSKDYEDELFEFKKEVQAGLGLEKVKKGKFDPIDMGHQSSITQLKALKQKLRPEDLNPQFYKANQLGIQKYEGGVKTLESALDKIYYPKQKKLYKQAQKFINAGKDVPEDLQNKIIKSNEDIQKFIDKTVKEYPLLKDRVNAITIDPINLNVKRGDNIFRQLGVGLVDKDLGDIKIGSIDDLTIKANLAEQTLREAIDAGLIDKSTGRQKLNKFLNVRDPRIEELLKIEGVTTADKIPIPEATKTRDMYKKAFKGEKGFISTDLLKDVARGAGAVSRGVGKGVGATLSTLSTPTAAGLFGLSEILDYKKPSEDASVFNRLDPRNYEVQEDPNVTTAGISLLLPELAKKTGLRSAILNPFNVGRAFTPLGIATILGSEGYKIYKQFEELEKLKREDPEAYEAFIKTRVADELSTPEDFAEIEDMGMVGAANGGLITRQAFKDGFDPKKRQTMKILGGLASIPVLGKYIKILGPLAPKVVETVERGSDAVPTFLYDLIAKVKAKGMKFFTGKSSDEFEYVYERDGYQVREQGNKITVRKRVDDGEMLDKDMEMELEVDPETGGLTYKEATARPDAEGKLKDVEEYIEDVDLEEMKKYTYDE